MLLIPLMMLLFGVLAACVGLVLLAKWRFGGSAPKAGRRRTEADLLAEIEPGTKTDAEQP